MVIITTPSHRNHPCGGETCQSHAFTVTEARSKCVWGVDRGQGWQLSRVPPKTPNELQMKSGKHIIFVYNLF